MKNWLTALISGMILTLVLLTWMDPHQDYNHDNPNQSAWFVYLPGWQTGGSPEHIIELKDWVGSGVENITVTVDDQRNAELEAEIMMRYLGLLMKNMFVRREMVTIFYGNQKKPGNTLP